MVNINFALVSLAASVANGATLSPRADDVEGSHARKGAPGSLSLINKCKFNLYVTHDGAKGKYVTLAPKRTMPDYLRLSDKPFTYQITTDKDDLAAGLLQLSYRANQADGLAEGMAHLYTVLKNPIPGQNVSITMAGSSASEGSAAAFALAAGNFGYGGAGTGTDGSMSLAMSASFCTKFGNSPDTPLPGDDEPEEPEDPGAVALREMKWINGQSVVLGGAMPKGVFSDLGIVEESSRIIPE